MILSDHQAACYLHQAGWPDNLIPMMVAIGHPESGLDTKAVNPETVDGKHHATGWLQVVNFPDRTAKYDLTDPLQNAQAAYDVYKSQGLKAWAVWPNPASAQVPKVQASLHGWSSSQCTASPSQSKTTGTGLTSSSDPTGITSAFTNFQNSLVNAGTIGLGVVIIAAALILLVAHTRVGKSLAGATPIGRVAKVLR